MNRILQSDGVPPFCRHAQEVVARTLDLEGSCPELARVVLQDLGLTSQLLRVANSARYNRSGRAVMSVAHAMILLGWDTVRNLVGTIRYIEYFAGRAPGLRELMLLSVLSAAHGRQIADLLGYPHPEDAHICGLFRNLGEVLIGCHYPQEYSNIILKMHLENIAARRACTQVLGFAWEDVALRVAAGWNMPPGLVHCLVGPAQPLGSPADRSLFSITDYAHDLTQSLYRHENGAEAFHLRRLVGPDGRPALLPARDLRRIIDSSLRETQQIFSSLEISSGTLRLEYQANRARDIIASTPTFHAAGMQAVDHAVEKATRALRQPDFELSALIGTLLDAVREAGFDTVVFAMVDEQYKTIRGRLGGATTDEGVLELFHFSLEHPDSPIMAALKRRTDILLDRLRDDRYDGSALVTTFKPMAFALFPVVVDGKAAACLYAGRETAAPGIESIRYSLARVRDTIAAAIKRKAPPA